MDIDPDRFDRVLVLISLVPIIGSLANLLLMQVFMGASCSAAARSITARASRSGACSRVQAEHQRSGGARRACAGGLDYRVHTGDSDHGRRPFMAMMQGGGHMANFGALGWRSCSPCWWRSLWRAGLHGLVVCAVAGRLQQFEAGRRHEGEFFGVPENIVRSCSTASSCSCCAGWLDPLDWASSCSDRWPSRRSTPGIAISSVRPSASGCARHGSRRRRVVPRRRSARPRIALVSHCFGRRRGARPVSRH